METDLCAVGLLRSLWERLLWVGSEQSRVGQREAEVDAAPRVDPMGCLELL